MEQQQGHIQEDLYAITVKADTKLQRRRRDSNMPLGDGIPRRQKYDPRDNQPWNETWGGAGKPEKMTHEGGRTYRGGKMIRKMLGINHPDAEVSKWADKEKAERMNRNYNPRNYCSNATCGHKIKSGEQVAVNPTNPRFRLCRNCFQDTYGRDMDSLPRGQDN